MEINFDQCTLKFWQSIGNMIYIGLLNKEQMFKKLYGLLHDEIAESLKDTKVYI